MELLYFYLFLFSHQGHQYWTAGQRHGSDFRATGHGLRRLRHAGSPNISAGFSRFSWHWWFRIRRCHGQKMVQLRSFRGLYKNRWLETHGPDTSAKGSGRPKTFETHSCLWPEFGHDMWIWDDLRWLKHSLPSRALCITVHSLCHIPQFSCKSPACKDAATFSRLRRRLKSQREMLNLEFQKFRIENPMLCVVGHVVVHCRVWVTLLDVHSCPSRRSLYSAPMFSTRLQRRF